MEAFSFMPGTEMGICKVGRLDNNIEVKQRMQITENIVITCKRFHILKYFHQINTKCKFLEIIKKNNN